MKRILLATLMTTFVATANAEFVTADNVVTANKSDYFAFQDTTDLIKNATDISYDAGSPVSGGSPGKESDYTSADYNTWTFSFNESLAFEGIYIWDYYGHTPKDWSISFYNESTFLGQTTFSLTNINTEGLSNFHEVSFSRFDNVNSIKLSNTSLASNIGVGLAEVHFKGASEINVSNVSTHTIGALSLLLIGGMAMSRKRKAG